MTSLDYVDGRDCIVSASDDCSLRLWAVYGAFVGIFGQETPWLPVEPPHVDPADDAAESPPADGPAAGAAAPGRAGGGGPWQVRRVPADVRRVASACTLRVMYGGHVPQWRATRAKLLAYVEVFQRVMNIVARQQKPASAAVDVKTTSRRFFILLAFLTLKNFLKRFII